MDLLHAVWAGYRIQLNVYRRKASLWTVMGEARLLRVRLVRTTTVEYGMLLEGRVRAWC
jgi:hypothetical protein